MAADGNCRANHHSSRCDVSTGRDAERNEFYRGIEYRSGRICPTGSSAAVSSLSKKRRVTTMKRALLLVLTAASCAFAQEKGNVIYQTTGAGGIVAAGGFHGASGPVLGAPYSATITNESIQTLADGNRLVQTSTGDTARDSQGRTRQDTVLPPIGNLSAADAPHLVFIQDAVAQTSYPMNLTDKSAQKSPMFSPVAGAPSLSTSSSATFIRMGNASTLSIADGPLPLQAGIV